MYLKFFKQHIKNLLKPYKYPEPKYLENTLKKLELHSMGSATISPIDRDSLIKAIYRIWQEKQEIGLREFMTYKIKLKIPYLLFHKIEQYDRIVENEKLLKVLLSILNPPKTAILRAIINVYIHNYNPELRGNEYLRTFIVQNLSSYKGKNLSLTHWKERINFFFTPYATVNTARWIMSQSKEIKDSLQELKLDGHFAKSNFLKYVILQITDNIDISKKSLKRLFDIMKINDGAVRFPDLLPYIAVQIIPKVKNYTNSDIRNLVISFFLDTLGDPNDPSELNNWNEIPRDVVEYFNKLLILGDIEFFFSVVSQIAKDEIWSYRKEFWLSYLPYIEKTWALLGSDAKNIAKSESRKYPFGSLLGASRNQSVFLIKISNFVFIEWSNSGACRVYKSINFPCGFGTEKCNAFEIRKKINPVFRLDHRNSESYLWQWKLIQWIRENLNITPQKSYYNKVKSIRGRVEIRRSYGYYW